MLTKERASQLLKPDFATGELTWIFNYQRPDLIGRRAGWLNEGYWRVTVDSQTYYCAEIIWLLAFGYLPEETIDHKDTNKANDALTNLRKATKAQNAMNSKLNARNTVGLKGVSYCKATNRYRADICISGTRKNLGRYDTAQEAHETWLAAAIVAFGVEFVRAA
jgi:hypothetical protein